MTIKEYVLKQKPATCADWVKRVEKDGLVKYEHLIIDCAEHFGLVLLNDNADFVKCVNV